MNFLATKPLLPQTNFIYNKSNLFYSTKLLINNLNRDIHYLKKLPKRQKSPETCCPSVKEGQKFINPWPSATIHEKSSNSPNFFFGIFNEYIKNSFVIKPKNQKLKVDLDLKTIHDYQENEKNVAMQLTWLGHAAILLQINSFTILFDPFLSNRASPFGFIGPYRCRERGFKSFSELPQIDFVVISHNHYDHLDKTTIKEIYAERKNSKHTKIICPLGLKKWFVRLDISKEQITECDWWDDIEVSKIEDDIKVDDSNALQEALSLANKKITISAVPCQHFSGRNIFDMGKSLWNGWVVKSQDASYYFAGDTGYRSIPDNCSEEDIEKYPFCPVFQQIGIIHGPFDLASIPIGPVMPVGMMSPIHASANDSVNIHIDCKSNHSVAIHWGTVENLGIDNIEYGPSELHTELKKKNISKEQFHEMYIGQIIKIEKKKN